MAWQDIDSSEVDASSPPTETLFGKLKGNLDFLEAVLAWYDAAGPTRQIRIPPVGWDWTVATGTNNLGVNPSALTTRRYGTFVTNSSGASAYALKSVAIPNGYKATRVTVYASVSTAGAVNVREGRVTNNTLEDDLGTGALNADINITDCAAGSINYITIIATIVATAELWGAIVQIERV